MRRLRKMADEIIETASDKEAALAYIYGFICHFALDSTCHGYIDEKIAQSGVSHTEIEVEFERHSIPYSWCKRSNLPDLFYSGTHS
jgi:hypothetical protein